MNSTQRLALIRSRLKPQAIAISFPFKPSGQHRASNPQLPTIKRKKPYIRGPEASRYSFSVYGEIDGTSTNRKKWVEKPDKPRLVSVAIKRKARVSPLTRISEQLPMKLPVLIGK